MPKKFIVHNKTERCFMIFSTLSLKNKIIIPSLAAIILLVAVLNVYTTISINNLTSELEGQSLETAIQTTNSLQFNLIVLGIAGIVLIAALMHLLVNL